VGQNINIYRVRVSNPERRDDLEDLGVDGKVIQILIVKKYDGKALTGLI
jgi:hypothetical protein